MSHPSTASRHSPARDEAYPAPVGAAPASREPQPGYPPFHVPKPVAPDVWIVDAPPIRAGGLPLPIRMVVIRLPNGTLLLHSPTPYHPALRDALEAIGPIRHLVAPGYGHWMYVQTWQRACPEASTWAVTGLRDRAPVRRAHLRIDADLDGDPPPAWGDAISLVPVHGPASRR